MTHRENGGDGRVQPVPPPEVPCGAAREHGADELPAPDDGGARERALVAAARAKALRKARKSRNHTAAQPVRAIGEDDDGYDPYSDFHDRHVAGPLFEDDPWS